MSHGKISKEMKTQTERNAELCKLIERKPGKMNESPLKVNDYSGSGSEKKAPESKKSAARNDERPRAI